MSIYTSKNIFYVYAYIRSKDSTIASKGTPYYIGKGSNGRAFNKSHGKIPVPNNKSNIVFLESNLSENVAFYIEKFFIACYGRIDLGTGILRNRTNGGEGSSGISVETSKKIGDANKRRNITPETRKKLSNAQKVRCSGKLNPMYGMTGENNPNYGKHHSAETKAKMSVAKIGENNNRYGIPHSEETKAKQRAANIGRTCSEETKSKLSIIRKEKSYPIVAN